MVRIIAEAGCNWSTIKEAKEFIKKSKELGLFATKFQLYNDEIIQDSEDYEFLKSIQLDYEKAKELFEYGKSIGQDVFFTPMYVEAVEWCEDIGCKYIKIRCKDNKNIQLITYAYHIYNYRTFMSIETLPHIRRKDPYLLDRELSNLKYLYCVPKYPARLEDYEEGFIRYSDHTPDLELFKKVREYCTLLEKHVKLDGTEPLEDKWSVSFSELEEVLNE